MSDDDSHNSNATNGEEEEITDLSNSDVCTKYQEAAKIVNLALTGIVSQCVSGAKIVDICQFGTAVLDAQVGKLYNKKVDGMPVEKGIAFPVCISVNEVVCNMSPLASDEMEPLKVGDCVKIDLGCHIDGYIAVAAHTIVVGETPESVPESIDPELGNVAVAAYNAMLVAADAIKAGAKNKEVTDAVQRVAKAYGVNTISSVRMHQMKRFVLDGVKEIALREPSAEEIDQGDVALPECTFEQAEVYAVDIAMTTGNGKVRDSANRVTVFKRNVEVEYKLKMKSSRYVLSEVDKKFPTLPFTLRHFDDEKQAKIGITECQNHGLLIPYHSLIEKKDAHVAHFKCTVLLLPSGTVKVTGLPLPSYFKTDKQADEETIAILNDIAEREAKKAAKKAAKKKKKKASA
jgi:curved DNA binding protein